METADLKVMSENLEKWREELRREIEVGGTLSPCPFCKLPRCQRSDYVRCSKCGINWLAEEMHLPDYLNKDPRVSRREAALTAGTAKASAAQSGEDAK